MRVGRAVHHGLALVDHLAFVLRAVMHVHKHDIVARSEEDHDTELTRLAEMTGTVSFGKETKGKIRLQITDPEGKVWEDLVPKEKNILVHEGQVVNKGESIVDGPADPQDILRLLGHGRAGPLHRR